MNMKPLALVLLAALFVAGDARAGLLQTLGSDWPYGIDGHNVVGVKGTGLGFLYNDLTQTSVTLPRLNNRNTPASAISGDNIVGAYRDSFGNQFGYLYSISTNTYTMLAHPLAGQGVQKGTTPWDIDGDNVVGNYVDAAGKQHGFLYNLATQTWTTLDYPGGAFATTSLGGISGNYIVGSYTTQTFSSYPLLYDTATSSWSTLLGNEGLGRVARGIDGDNVVGGTAGGGGGGWIYNLATSTFSTPLNDVPLPPGQILSSYDVKGISGNTIVGTYNYWNGSFFASSGYVYIGVPELGTFSLTAVAAGGLALLSIGGIRRGMTPSPSSRDTTRA